MLSAKWKIFSLSCLCLALLSMAPSTVSLAQAHGECCLPCCAPPPPVEVSWCVVDPCTGCKYEVSACLPACCACQTPCLLEWRKGLFGRKILTYKFDCGECVTVLITRHGAKVK